MKSGFFVVGACGVYLALVHSIVELYEAMTLRTRDDVIGAGSVYKRMYKTRLVHIENIYRPSYTQDPYP